MNVPVNKDLLTGTHPVNKELWTGTHPVNKELLTGTHPVNKELLTGTFRSIASSLSKCPCISEILGPNLEVKVLHS